MARTWDSRDRRKLHLLACVEYWEMNPVADDERTARALTQACALDYIEGLLDPTPWLAMADLEETAGYETAMLRESIVICFASSSSSSSAGKKG